MIPSEFNQDIMAAQRKLRMLHEARIRLSPGAARRGREQAATFKVGDRVRIAPNSQLGKEFGVDGLSTTGTITSVKPAANNVKLGVKWDGKKKNRGDTFASSVVKEETTKSESVFRGLDETISIVAADNRTGEVILRIPEGQPSKPATQLALLASRIKGSVFKLLEPKRLNPRGQLFSFKGTQFRSPTDVAKFLRKEVGDLFNG